MVNPISGRSRGRRQAPRLARGLRDRGFEVETVATRGRGDARRAVERVEADGRSAILCVGGDGTLNEVINGLGEKDISVAVFPTGTGNVLAKELGIRPRVGAVCDAVAGGRTVGLTLGEANGRRFGLFVGGGFDAAVVEQFEKRRSGGASKLSYLIPIVKALAGYRFPEMRVTVDGEPAGTASNVLVTNTRSYGGPFELVPDADPTDGVFDVCLVSGGRRLDLVRHMWA
ncbi:MAG: diacylglycerol/lipid kinase family protein, partial [bacterium]